MRGLHNLAQAVHTMRVFVVVVRSNFLKGEVKEPHSAVFHGIASRGGQEFPHDKTVWFDDSWREPLHIIRSGSFIPKVFCPSSHLVLREDIAQEFRGMAGIELLPVILERLVNVDFPIDLDYWAARWGHYDGRKVLRSQPDCDELKKTAGQFFELVTNRLIMPKDGERDGARVQIDIATPPFTELIDVPISNERLKSTPVFWARGVQVFSEHAFEIIRTALDERFFVVREYAC